MTDHPPRLSGDCLVGNCWACVDHPAQRQSVVTGKPLPVWGCTCGCHNEEKDR